VLTVVRAATSARSTAAAATNAAAAKGRAKPEAEIAGAHVLEAGLTDHRVDLIGGVVAHRQTHMWARRNRLNPNATAPAFYPTAARGYDSPCVQRVVAQCAPAATMAAAHALA
jgi:hypothetical protein